MGKRGTKPKPTDQKKAAGTWRADRNFADELQFDPLSEEPKAPDFLGEYGRQEWDRVVTQLMARGVLSETDLSIVTAYCLEMQGYFEDRDLTRKEKYITLTNKAGEEYLTAHPAVNSGNKHLAAALKIATEFGFTPSSRTRISVGKSKDKNPDEEKLLKLTKNG